MMICACCVCTVAAAEASQHQGSGSVARKDAETALDGLPQGSYQDTGFFQVSQSVLRLPADAHSSYAAPGKCWYKQVLWYKDSCSCWIVSVTGVFGGRDHCLTAFDAHVSQLCLQQDIVSFQLVFVLHLRQQNQHVQC